MKVAGHVKTPQHIPYEIQSQKSSRSLTPKLQPTMLDCGPIAVAPLDVARTLSAEMDSQNSELVKQQVQAELANAYAQEFFTVRPPIWSSTYFLPLSFRRPTPPRSRG